METQRFTLGLRESVSTGPAHVTLVETRPGRAILYTARSVLDSFGQPRHFHQPKAVVFVGSLVPSACHLPIPCELRLVAVDHEAGTATFDAEVLDRVPIVVHDERLPQPAPAPQPSDFGELTTN